ncbi:MAG: hypothetical protein IJU20_08065 [Clostridia bacterium]|nr:hypothetical protein [Clostridia bacterium]
MKPKYLSLDNHEIEVLLKLFEMYFIGKEISDDTAGHLYNELKDEIRSREAMNN